MIVFPRAKINLGLRIIARRNDGYHDIETIFYPAGLCDALEFVPQARQSDGDTLAVTGIPVGVGQGDNIVMKALGVLRARFSFPALRIHLHKAIPHGAGLGGGSSDAACFMKSVAKHFSLPVTLEELYGLSLVAGSDCPFFISGEPSYATGRGEILSPAGKFLAGYYLVLLNPGVGISTGEAYRNCTPSRHPDTLTALTRLPVDRWKDHIKNDFEAYAFSVHPVIGTLKEELYRAGALFSLMSGSGSSVYGIFSAKPGRLPGNVRSRLIWEGSL